MKMDFYLTTDPKNRLMKKFSFVFLPAITLLIVAFIFVSGCKKNNNDPPAPELPPETSFLMDFADFSNPDDTLRQKSVESYKNWGHAYSQVVVWNTVLKVALAVPVASYLQAFNSAGVYHPEDESWVWIYGFKLNGVQHIGELTAFMKNDNVIWEMRISKENHYDNFLWYHGLSTTDQFGGYWIINENPENPNELLRIEWVNLGDGQKGIRYTNIKKGSPDEKSYISYGAVNSKLDRYYRIYTMRYDNLTEIEWNHTDFQGRSKDAWHFEDIEWHCWGSNLQDVTCP